MIGDKCLYNKRDAVYYNHLEINFILNLTKGTWKLLIMAVLKSLNFPLLATEPPAPMKYYY